tara:strand:- start:1173 stop:1391 length:219 start_codon:yes stop_codon:yes gene_type:complete
LLSSQVKVSNWDNGLSPEEQAIMDDRWEKLLAKVKEIDPVLYKKIQDESLEYFLTDNEPTKQTENNQFNFHF